jgi:hypothetical protein
MNNVQESIHNIIYSMWYIYFPEHPHPDSTVFVRYTDLYGDILGKLVFPEPIHEESFPQLASQIVHFTRDNGDFWKESCGRSQEATTHGRTTESAYYQCWRYQSAADSRAGPYGPNRIAPYPLHDPLRSGGVEPLRHASWCMYP